MAKQESKGRAQPSVEPAPNVDAMPKMALAVVEAPKAPAAVADGSPPAEPVSAPSLVGTQSTATEVDMTFEPPGETKLKSKIELATIEAPRIAPDLDEVAAVERASAGAASAENTASVGPGADAAETPRPARGQGNRFALLAASLALAAAFGGMVGAIGATSLLRPAAPVPASGVGRSGLEEIQVLKENVVQSRVELAAVKSAIETANRGTSAQLGKIAERVDRIERGQAEPVARLSKAVDALERTSRGGDNKEVTGAVTTPAATSAAATSKPAAVVDGWVVRDVHRGTALLEGRMGLIEVDQGDVVPGLGRVEAIRKQDGRWVVSTSKGLIMPAR